MIEYVNSFLVLTLLGIIHHTYHKYKIVFRAINILMDSVILDQLNSLEKEVDAEITKIKRVRKKKTDTKTLHKINEEVMNDIIDKRERLIACVLSVNSKQYLGKNTLNSKLMKWTLITLVYCQIDTNLL